jgi:biopolymer transport protein ExbB
MRKEIGLTQMPTGEIRLSAHAWPLFTWIRRITVMVMAMIFCAGLPTFAAESDSEDPEGAVEIVGEGETAGSAETGETDDDVTVMRGVSALERLQQGGWPMLFLLALSIAASSFAIERVFSLRREAVVPAGLSEQANSLWEAKKYDELTALCKKHPSTLASVIQALVRHRHCGYTELSTLSGDLAARDMRNHLQKAHPIAVVATLSPLIGLLGTVIGMIESFEVVAIAGSLGDASLLAGGISMALVTTATGLIIAAPALAIYHYFRTRANRFGIVLEGEVNELLTSWFLEPATSTPEETP